MNLLNATVELYCKGFCLLSVIIVMSNFSLFTKNEYELPGTPNFALNTSYTISLLIHLAENKNENHKAKMSSDPSQMGENRPREERVPYYQKKEDEINET